MGTLPPSLKRRSVDQTLVGLYWAYDGARGLGTPPRLYNLIVREIAIQRNNDDDANARLFALVNAAMADAAILAWEEKYRHDFSGHATFGAAALHMVRLFYGVPTGNRQPDQIFTGDFVSEELDGFTRDRHGVVRPKHRRRFPQGLWQMILENGYSRVYLGVHWHFDAFALDSAGAPDLSQKVGGVRLGLDIAEDIFAAGNGLGTPSGPLNGPNHPAFARIGG